MRPKDAVFFQLSLQEGFAVVDTGGYSGIHIYRGNIPAGRTEEKGLGIASGLQPYTTKRIRIKAQDLPINV